MSKRPGDPGYEAGWCIHYRGSFHNATCEVGEAYTNFKDDQAGRGWPCFTKNQNPMPCAKMRLPTAEEVALHEKWVAARIKDIGKAQAVIFPYRTTHRGQRVEVECPVCKGRLHFSIAAYNGHVHARCTTEGCIGFME